MSKFPHSVNLPLPLAVLTEMDHAAGHGVTVTRLRRWLDLPLEQAPALEQTLLALARHGYVERIGNYFWIQEKNKNRKIC